MLSLVNALHTVSSSFYEQQYSLLLDGTDDYLDIGEHLDITTGDFAISAWVKIDPNVTAKFPIVSKRHVTSNNGYSVYVEANQNYLRGYVQDSDGTGTHVHGPVSYTNIKDGNWHHIFVLFDRDGDARGFVDGYSDGTVLDITGAEKTLISSANLTIGKTLSSTFANGKIDEVALFNQVLTSNAPKGIYNDGIPFDLNSPSPDGGYTQHAELYGYWRMFNGLFDDKVNTIVHDAHNPGFGADLVTGNNATFDGANDWTAYNPSGTTSISTTGGVLQVTLSGAGNTVDSGARIDLASSLTVGKTYKVEADIWLGTSSTTDGIGWRIFLGSQQKAIVLSTTKTRFVAYLRISSTAQLTIYNSDVDSDTGTFFIDNVSVKELSGFPAKGSADATFSTDTPDDQITSNILTLDGTNDYLATEADSTLATRTYSFWCRATSTTTNAGLFGHGAVDHGGFHINPYFNSSYNTNPIIYLGSSFYRYFVDTPAQDDGTWHHWAVYIDHTDITNCTVHVDGVALSVEATVASGSADAWTTGLTIGKTTGYFFRGDIDQFAVFDTELAADAVASLAGQMWEQGDTYTTNWSAQGNNTIDVNDGAVRVTMVDNDDGIRIDLAKTADGGALNSSIIPGRTYKLTCEMKVGSGDTVNLNLGEAIQSSAITSTTFVTVTLYYTPDPFYPDRDHLRFNDLNSGGEAWIKSISLIDTNARQNDLTKTIGNYDSDWTDNLINYWKMGDGASDEPDDGIIHDQTDSGYGAELVTNGDFATAGSVTTSSYTLGFYDGGGDVGITISSGVLNLFKEDTDANSGRAYLSNGVDGKLVLVNNKTYRVTYTIAENSASSALQIWNGATYQTLSNTVGTHSDYFIHDTSIGFVVIKNGGSASSTIKISNISLKQLNGDPGMTTSGATIIKQPV